MNDLPKGWIWRARQDVLQESPRSGDGLEKPDAVIHLEVKQHVYNPTDRDKQEFQAVNVHGTARWLHWAGERSISRFIFFSSIKAVGDSPFCQDETAALPPTSEYGRSKLAGEKLVQGWAAANPKRSALILRLAAVYGPGNRANMLSFVRAIEKGHYFLTGQGDNSKSIVSLRNVCAAVNHLLLRRQPGVEVFNLVDPTSLTVRELAAMIAQLLRVREPKRSVPLPLARAVAIAGDFVEKVTRRNFPLTTARLKALTETTHFSCEKLIRAGFRHHQTTEEGLAEMVAWYRQNFAGHNTD